MYSEIQKLGIQSHYQNVVLMEATMRKLARISDDLFVSKINYEVV